VREHRLVHAQVQRQRLAAGDHHEQQREPGPADRQQHHRQYQQRGRFGPVGIHQRRRVAAQPRMGAGPGKQPGQQRVGAPVEPAPAVDHQRPHQRQQQRQRPEHQRQPVGHGRDRLVGSAEDPARRQERGRPQDRREQADGHVAPERHPQHARDRRYERPHGADEARDQDAFGAVAAEQGLAAFDHAGIAGERPALAQLRAPAAADPEAQGVAEEGARGGACDGVGPVDVPQPDQCADREQQRQRRHHDPDHGQRIEEGDQEHHQPGRRRMLADPRDGRLEPGRIHGARL
jgi:hypothetical protein